MENIENTKFMDMAQILFLIDRLKNNNSMGKHKFSTLTFFLKEPLYLEKLCSLFKPNKISDLKIRNYERYNLLHNEQRVSLWDSKLDLRLSSLVGKNLLKIDYSEEGYSFIINEQNGRKLIEILKKDNQLNLEYKRAGILISILGKKSFSEIKIIIMQHFAELNL